jgi:hypothetical protein
LDGARPIKPAYVAVIFMLATGHGQHEFDATVSAFMAQSDKIAAVANRDDASRGIANG